MCRWHRGSEKGRVSERNRKGEMSISVREGDYSTSMLRSLSQKEQAVAGYAVYTGSYKTLIGTGCVNARTMRVRCGFLETRPQKAAVQFLSEMARSVHCLRTILVVLHSVLLLI